jgi:DNA-binding beta-propeller fold protein YncE
MVILLGSAAFAGEASPPRRASFASKPRSTGSNGKRTITFAVKSATDVEVAILDAGGKVVRHLAAGFVGGRKAPAPPLKAGLSQSIVWDGKDDYGKPVSGAKVRVRLGLKPELSHFVGFEPARHGGVNGLGCSPKGELYVMYRCGGPGHHYASMAIKAYNREGNYLRTLMPYPAGLKPEERAAVKWFEFGDGGAPAPLIYFAHSRVMYPQVGSGSRHNLMVRPDGRVCFATHPFDRPSISTRRLVTIGADGSFGKDLLGPIVGPGGWLLTALSPDGKTVYVSAGRGRKGPVNAVFKTTFGASGKQSVFVGSGTAAGSGPAQLSNPRGVAVDGKSNVYVADHGNNRVSVFDAAGKPLAQMPAQYADLVAVHPKTGAVYVLCTKSDPKRNTSRGWGSGVNYTDKTLLKFASHKAKAPAAKLVLCKKSPARPIMALDSSGAKAVLWIAGIKWGAGGVRKIVDTGSAFKDEGQVLSSKMKKGVLGAGWLDMAVERGTGRILVGASGRYAVGAHQWDGNSGKYLGKITFKSKMSRGKWGEAAFDWRGEKVLHSTSLEKHYLFKPDGSPLAWSALGKNETGPIPQGFTHARGHAPLVDGSFYMAHHFKHRDYKRGAVTHISADGKIARKEFVKLGAPIGGVKADLAGNAYVAAHIKPAGETFPGWFKGKVPTGQSKWYKTMYGSILKVKKEGGQINATTDAPVVWAYHGVSPMPSRRTARCSCQIPRFDVDLYGRVWVPDCFRFGVAVLDNNANPVARFGEYGNCDSAGPESARPSAKIPLAWIHSVTATDKFIFLADVMNHRIVACTYGAQAEEVAGL